MFERTRGMVSDGHPLIAGFVIAGKATRRVLIRAIGPSLSTVLPGMISDPMLSLYHTGAQTPFASNDDWMLNRANAVIQATSARVGAFALTANTTDAVLLMTLAPGGYTAMVTGVNGASGIALVEVYDAD